MINDEKRREVKSVVTLNNIKDCIYNLRGVQVMLDRDLAEMYDVETKYLNRAVKRNNSRFPEKFRFQLTDEEYENLKFQIGTSREYPSKLQDVTSSSHGGRRKLPYVFTEQGVSMLSAVLRSETAVKVSIQIMDTFVEMRKFIATNSLLFLRIDRIETMQQIYQINTDTKFKKIFKALEDKSVTPKYGLFYDGQVFDAYSLIADITRSAKESIILIDNYVDDTVLKLFTKRRKGVKTTIYCKILSKILKQDLVKHNSQYEPIEIRNLKTAHDRFLIIDEKIIYHFGASLKDLGKKWFAFSKMKMEAKEIIDKL